MGNSCQHHSIHPSDAILEKYEISSKKFKFVKILPKSESLSSAEEILLISQTMIPEITDSIPKLNDIPIKESLSEIKRNIKKRVPRSITKTELGKNDKSLCTQSYLNYKSKVIFSQEVDLEEDDLITLELIPSKQEQIQSFVCLQSLQNKPMKSNFKINQDLMAKIKTTNFVRSHSRKKVTVKS